MEGYLIWLVFLALAVLSVSIIHLQAGRNNGLQKKLPPDADGYA